MSDMYKEAFMKPYVEAVSYSQNTLNGNRSSKRTDTLNDLFVEKILLPIFSVEKGYDIRKETKIDCARGESFKMDIVVYKGDRIVAMFPLKAIEKNFNKNRHNYANTIIGEAQRIWGKEGFEDRKKTLVMAVDWIPNYVLQGVKMERTKPPAIDQNYLQTMASIFYPESKHYSFKIKFDFDFKTCKSSGLNEQEIYKMINILEEWERNFE